jgi:hypothetical protein
MALDPATFTLDAAIHTVWNDAALLTTQEKAFIGRCLPTDVAMPSGEAQLSDLQLALSASELLDRLGNGPDHWLTAEGRSFPAAARRFVYHTAKQFHLHETELPDAFLDALAGHLVQTRSHLATLNYDNLLYQPLIERRVLRGYEGGLVDGFLADGFSDRNFERRPGRDFGFYLHLHGSPLFVDDGDRTIKLRQAALPSTWNVASRHIVLTHIDHKPAVIAASCVLQAYWNRLKTAIGEAETIVVFGYSGVDRHVNMQIRAAGAAVRVVEWRGAGDNADRQRHWATEFGRDVELVHMDNILEFTDW